MQTPPPEEEKISSEKKRSTFYKDRPLSFSIVKCDDPSHCSRYVKIFDLSGLLLQTIFRSGTTIGMLKDRLREKHSIAPENQRLIYRGKDQLDCTTLSELEIRDGDVVHFVFK